MKDEVLVDRIDSSRNVSRRCFLNLMGGKVAELSTATIIIYSVGLVAKDLDGRLTAGAKTCGYDQGIPLGGERGSCGSISCDQMYVPTGSSCAGQSPLPSVCCSAFSSPCTCSP